MAEQLDATKEPEPTREELEAVVDLGRSDAQNKHEKRQSNTEALYLVRWDRWCVREGRTRYTAMRRRDDDGSGAWRR